MIASEDAHLGTPYARVWGCYLTGMWIYRLGLTRVKELALTGRPLSGVEAAQAGLINRAVPFAELEDTVMAEARLLSELPPVQLAAVKLIVNQAYENMGLHSTQLLGPILEGCMRNIPESLRFVEVAAREGVGEAIHRRDALRRLQPGPARGQAGSRQRDPAAPVIDPDQESRIDLNPPADFTDTGKCRSGSARPPSPTRRAPQPIRRDLPKPLRCHGAAHFRHVVRYTRSTLGGAFGSEPLHEGVPTPSQPM